MLKRKNIWDSYDSPIMRKCVSIDVNSCCNDECITHMHPPFPSSSSTMVLWTNTAPCSLRAFSQKLCYMLGFGMFWKNLLFPISWVPSYSFKTSFLLVIMVFIIMCYKISTLILLKLKSHMKTCIQISKNSKHEKWDSRTKPWKKNSQTKKKKKTQKLYSYWIRFQSQITNYTSSCHVAKPYLWVTCCSLAFGGLVLCFKNKKKP
jgi:hypothetical protein